MRRTAGRSGRALRFVPPGAWSGRRPSGRMSRAGAGAGRAGRSSIRGQPGAMRTPGTVIRVATPCRGSWIPCTGAAMGVAVRTPPGPGAPVWPGPTAVPDPEPAADRRPALSCHLLL